MAELPGMMNASPTIEFDAGKTLSLVRSGTYFLSLWHFGQVCISRRVYAVTQSHSYTVTPRHGIMSKLFPKVLSHVVCALHTTKCHLPAEKRLHRRDVTGSTLARLLRSRFSHVFLSNFYCLYSDFSILSHREGVTGCIEITLRNLEGSALGFYFNHL